jgi:hypothetical protein
MANSAIDYANLTGICEFTRALHLVHEIGGDEVIDLDAANDERLTAETNVVGVGMIRGRAAPQFEARRRIGGVEFPSLRRFKESCPGRGHL